MEKNFRDRFKDRLQERRKECGFKSGYKLAYQINIKGQTISNYENGKTLPDAEILCKLANKLNCTTDYLSLKEDAPTHESSDIVKATGLSSDAVTRLIFYHDTIDDLTTERFLSDLICSNYLRELALCYYAWLDEVRAQKGYDPVIDPTYLIESGEDPADIAQEINAQMRIKRSVPYNLDGLRYGIIKRFEEFLTERTKEE